MRSPKLSPEMQALALADAEYVRERMAAVARRMQRLRDEAELRKQHTQMRKMIEDRHA